MEDRIKRIKKNKHISQEEALDRIAYKDRQRRDYYNFYTGHEWGKMENYDICLNTSVLSEEECVELLMKLAEQKYIKYDHKEMRKDCQSNMVVLSLLFTGNIPRGVFCE